MRKNDLLHLGIELNEREIRLVQAGSKGGRPYVVDMVAEALPLGAMMGGVVLEPGTVSIALRRALDAIGNHAPTSAAIGVSSEQSNFRAINVPPCPDSELPALVASEVEHQNSLNPGDLFGFFPVQPVGPATDAMQSLTVVGVDPSVAQTLVELMEGVGLTVAAIEPMPLAMLRTVATTLPAGASAFILVVGATQTEAAYFVDGRLAAFRRLDVGMDALVLSFVPYVEDEADPSGFAAPPENWSHIDQEAADRLALEAQRTMDYVQRAGRATSTLDRVRVICDDVRFAPLSDMLERRFGLPVELVLPPPLGEEAPDSRFAGAYGLAIRNGSSGLIAPTVDLYMAQRSEAQRVETKRYFLGSVLVAALSIAVGIGGCLLYNGQIAASKARCATVDAGIADAKKGISATLDAQADEAARDKVLRKEGVPLGTLMDYVSSGVDSGVGVKLVSIADNLDFHIEGEARDETALVRTAQALKGSPVMLNVAVDRFDRSDKEKTNDGTIAFVISGATVSGDRIADPKTEAAAPEKKEPEKKASVEKTK